jgi:glycerol-3-phosphate acyltransferase PlsX
MLREKKVMIIAVDAMGGDNSPHEIVKGAVNALEFITSDIMLIGDEEKIINELSSYKFEASRIIINHASEVITNEEKPVKAIKAKKDSSLVVGFSKLKSKEVECLISAGNTGALLAGGLLKVGRIKGVDRPAIASVYPNVNGMAILVDAGANTECKPRNLLEFGIMGSIYAESVLEIEKPKVGIVTNGAEEGKGTKLVIDSYKLLEEADINFTGNLESRDIPEGTCDVMVCDGFTGNLILKLSEGLVKSFGGLIKDEFIKNPLVVAVAILLKGKLRKLKRKFDYKEYGGAPLLGVDGLIVKAHGSSDAKAIMNAIIYGEKCAKNEVVEKIRVAIGENVKRLEEKELKKVAEEMNEI